MKKIIILTAILTALSCKAQNPIVSFDAYRHTTPDGAYYKDLDNEFNKFEGSWTYINGNTSLTIILQKKELIYVNNDYRDILVGEYRYSINGVEIINTLPLLTNNPDNIDIRNIGGGNIIPNNMYVACDDCLPNERRVKLYISDPERSYLSASIVLRYLTNETNPEKMTVTIFSNGGVIIPNVDSPTSLRVPYGEYLMIKQ